MLTYKGNSVLRIGLRARFNIPERGVFSLGFGKITKINRKTVLIQDEKFNEKDFFLVAKELIFETIQFEDSDVA